MHLDRAVALRSLPSSDASSRTIETRGIRYIRRTQRHGNAGATKGSLAAGMTREEETFRRLPNSVQSNHRRNPFECGSVLHPHQQAFTEPDI